ncbi:MOSC domain containing protein [Haloterrigena turkmenica DSM 5511]|uniref:MOSC domain containing protein n=1 Tax=Haloterrigena turkmenica (strain ATCC 51198 / DSM 5511 / JCM 9101 / NCIMB 13204 / VKM B-1734 / 4k) TaxID=543526 RepID=D2RYX0_HALTV|nr:MOSC domain-containing protein [Haloterrigena turkmenica]ADB61938.1 MOSC domain containing protein [Haloterrigena turkmenica DSM 5511]
MTGRVRAIHVAPAQGKPMERVEEATAVAGRGLEGDRYFDTEGTFADRDGSDITFIEREALEAVERDYDIALEPGMHRRNVTTEGVALNHLDGERFRVGDVVCEGTERCEPCSYLERHLEAQGVREALVHRGGLRARILEDGALTAGDGIERIN